MPILRLEKLTKIYGRGHAQVKAVRDVDLKVEKGEIVLVMGPSGSGKTTLIMMAGALLNPTHGKVFVKEKEISKLSQKELSHVRLNELGFIFQSFNLLSSLTAQENVAIPCIIKGVKKNEALKHAQIALEKLGLAARLSNLPRDLSGGEKQRVSIARALVNNPDLIFADEPTANLDSQSGHEVMNLLCATACQEEKSVIIVSHDQRLKDVAHRVIYMEDGKLISEEPGDHNQTCTMKTYHKNPKKQ